LDHNLSRKSGFIFLLLWILLPTDLRAEPEDDSNPITIYCQQDCSNCSNNANVCIQMLAENLDDLCNNNYPQTNCFKLWDRYVEACNNLCSTN